jgi:DNA mismatch repair ATPase MutS
VEVAEGDCLSCACLVAAVASAADSFVLQDARRRSLVLIDELCKGTEVLSGTALSAAMLKTLLGAGAR